MRTCASLKAECVDSVARVENRGTRVMHRANVVCTCARRVTPCCSSLRPRFEPCQQEHTTTFGNGGTLNTVQCAHAVPGWCFLSPHDHGPRAIRAFFGENLKCYSGLPAFLVPIAGFLLFCPHVQAGPAQSKQPTATDPETWRRLWPARPTEWCPHVQFAHRMPQNHHNGPLPRPFASR